MRTGSRKRLALISGWAVTALLAAVTVNRLLRPDTQPLLIGIQGVTVWLLAPALPLAALACWRRRWTLAGTALLIGVAQLGWTAAAIGWHGPQPAPAGSVPFRLVTANVLLDNPSLAALADELAGSGADVIVLQEITPQHLATLATSSLWNTYPERVLDPLPGFHGSAILSRLPIIAGRAIDVAGFPMTRADVDTPAGPVRIIDVHTVAPIDDANTDRWRRQLAALAQMQPADNAALIMAGDFNATVDHAPFAALLASGKRDAFLLAGSGYGATWPSWRGPTFPVMRLDHVLVSDRVGVVSVTEQTSTGSDHRRLVAELALPGPS